MNTRMNLWSCLVLLAGVNIINSAPTQDSSAEDNSIAKLCYQKYNLKPEDAEALSGNSQDTPKKMLCYLKCFFEKKGLLDKEGKLVLKQSTVEEAEDRQESNWDSDEDSSEEKEFNISRDEDLACLQKIDPIRTCGDMRHLLKCLPKEKSE